MLLCLATGAAAGFVRLLPERYSLQPRLGTEGGYLSLPLTPEISLQEGIMREFSISMWVKCDDTPATSAFIFALGQQYPLFRLDQGFDSRQQIYISFPVTDKLTFDCNYWELGGGVYSGARAALDYLGSDRNWHFIGAGLSFLTSTLQLCCDATCASQTFQYSSVDFLTSDYSLFIGGLSAKSSRFVGRVGDMLFYPAQYLAASNFAGIRSGKQQIPGCTPVSGSLGGFYDGCAEFALMVGPALVGSNGYSPVLGSGNGLYTAPGDQQSFYGRSFDGSQFVVSGWVSIAAATNVIEFILASGQYVYLSVLAGDTLDVVFGTHQALASGCEATDGFMYFKVKVETTDVHVICGVTVIVTGAMGTGLGSSVSQVVFGTTSFNNVKWEPITASPTLTPPLIEADIGCDTMTGSLCTHCKDGFYLSSGRCKVCHRYCGKCSNAGYSSCLSCSSTNYQQPGLPTTCRPYCPTGFAPNSSSVCSVTPSPSRTVLFDNNLAGDFALPTGERLLYGFNAPYYPDFDFADPTPVNGRGVYFTHSTVMFESSTGKSDLVLGTDFTVEFWALPFSSCTLFQVESGAGNTRYHLIFDIEAITPTRTSFGSPSKYGLSLTLTTFGNNPSYPPVTLPVPNFGQQWYHLGFIVAYNPVTKQTEATLFINGQTIKYTFSSYFLMPDPSIVSMSSGRYYLYSLSVVNKAKSMTEVVFSEGSCTACSACPLTVNACLPVCKPTEFVTKTGTCQACPQECKFGCNNADTCNMCPDPLCYACSSEDAAVPCSVCIPGASVVSGLCQCPAGQVLNHGKCDTHCDEGSYYSSADGQCVECTAGCLDCQSQVCVKCREEFVLQGGVCTCGKGFYVSQQLTCEKCESNCKECTSDDQTCSECYTEDGYYLDSGKCKDCRSLPGYEGALGVTIARNPDQSLTDYINSVCKETCGDGVTMGQLPCDDGNLATGDGCSQLCTIEPGWSCTTVSGKSVCSDTSSPTARLTYLRKTDTQFELLLTFSEPIQYQGNPQDTITLSFDKLRLFEFTAMRSDLAQAYSPISISVTPLESVRSNSQLTLQFQDFSTVTDLSGNKIASREVSVIIPDHLELTISEAISSAMRGTSPATAAVTSLSAVTSAFSGSNFNMIWSFVDILQLINYIVYMSAFMPDNLRTFLRALSFANFEFIPSVLDGHTNDYFGPPPQPFVIEDMSSDFIINIGNMITIWLGLVLLYLVLALLAWCLPSAPVLSKVKTWFKYTVFLSCGLESFLQLALAICLQLRQPSPQSTLGGFSLALCAFVVAYLSYIVYLAVTKVALQSGGVLRHKMHRWKYGALYREYREDGVVSRSFLLALTVRRLLFVLFLVFLPDFPLVQAVLCTVLCLAYMGLLIVFRPEKQFWTGNMLEIASGTLLCIVHGLVCVLASVSLSIDTRDGIGWAAIAILLVLILLHLTVLAVQQVHIGRKLLRKANTYISRKSTDMLPSSQRLGLSSIRTEDFKPTEDDTHRELELTLSGKLNPHFESSFGQSASIEPETAVDIRPVFVPRQ